MSEFRVVSPFEPQGDQPEAIESLANGVLSGDKLQVLLRQSGIVIGKALDLHVQIVFFPQRRDLPHHGRVVVRVNGRLIPPLVDEQHRLGIIH